MAQLMCIVFVTVSLWILHKSTTECVDLFSSNGKAPVFPGYESGTEQQPAMIQNPKVPLLSDTEERMFDVSFGTNGSGSSLTPQFVTCFTERILSSRELTKIYDTSLSPEKAEEAYSRIVYTAEINVQTPEARSVSSIISRAIRATFRRLTSLQHIQTYGYAAAEFMISMKVLTDRNVTELCHSYVSYNEQEVKYLPHIPDRRYAFIQAISNGLVHFMASLGIYRADSVRLLSQYFAGFLYHVARVSNRLPEKPCPEDDLVAIFAAELTHSVMVSPKLAEIYDTSLPPDEAGKTYYRVVFNPVANVHACDPGAVARVCANAIRDTFANLSPAQHVYAHGYAIARRMKFANVLTCKNVYKLCDSYATYVAEAAANVPSVPDRRYAFIQAVADSHVHFTTSMNLYADGTFQLAEEFAVYLYSLAGIPYHTSLYHPPSCFGNISRIL